MIFFRGQFRAGYCLSIRLPFATAMYGIIVTAQVNDVDPRHAQPRSLGLHSLLSTMNVWRDLNAFAVTQ